MRNAALHRLLEAFTVEASGRLSAELAQGAEMPFEVLEQRGSGPSLYCYRPLSGDFIAGHREQLSALGSHDAAASALEGAEAIDVYLAEHGEPRVPAQPRARAEAALAAFLGAVYAERSDFGFEPAHFEAAYAELERTIFDGHGTATVLAPVLGVGLDPDTTELSLGDGLSLIRGDGLPDAPPDAVWGDGTEPNVLAVLAADPARASRPPVALARTRFRRLLSALRLFAPGGYAVGPLAFARTEAGAWRPVPIGVSGRPRSLTVIAPEQADELRAFCDLVTRRRPGGGELAWALARFEMGCERLAPFEALTDYLLALRALLEPEGPSSGRLAQRLAAICAPPEGRAALAERTARASALERTVISGLAIGETQIDGLVEELSEHLRAILRDALCGHLDSDLVSLADDLLAEAAAAVG